MLPKKEITIFISCPEDVKKEKIMVIDACKILQDIFKARIILNVVEWKQNTVPLITGEGAQSVINDQIKDNYDIYIGILWKRFGKKQSNGLTPTEEEFERALKRYKNTKKPLITIYFKTDDTANHETEQILAVQKFKERTKELGLYFDFKDGEFKEKILHDIGCEIENWFLSTSFKPLINLYKENKNYLQRKVASTQDYSEFGFNLLSRTGDLLDIIEKQSRVVAESFYWVMQELVKQPSYKE